MTFIKMEENYFLPSEIARLVLGYLKEIDCKKSQAMFMKESTDLTEYVGMLNIGREFPTTVAGKSLQQVLQEYARLKLAETRAASNTPQITACLWRKLDGLVTEIKHITTPKLLSTPLFAPKRRYAPGRPRLSHSVLKIPSIGAHEPGLSEKISNDIQVLAETRQGVMSSKVQPVFGTRAIQDSKEAADTNIENAANDQQNELVNVESIISVTSPCSEAGKQTDRMNSSVGETCVEYEDRYSEEATELSDDDELPTVISHNLTRSASGAELATKNVVTQRMTCSSAAPSPKITNAALLTSPVIMSSETTKIDNVMSNKSASNAVSSGCVVDVDRTGDLSESLKCPSIVNIPHSSPVLSALNDDISDKIDTTCTTVPCNQIDNTVTVTQRITDRNVSITQCAEPVQPTEKENVDTITEIIKTKTSLHQPPMRQCENAIDSFEQAKAIGTTCSNGTIQQQLFESEPGKMLSAFNCITTLSAGALKTPVKTNFLDETSSSRMDSESNKGRSPRRKRSAPRRTTTGDILPQPFVDVLNNSELHQKLAMSINQTMLRSLVGTEEVIKTAEHHDSSLVASELPSPSTSGNTSQALESILDIHETQMSGDIIGNIIDSTKNDPAFEGLFNLFDITDTYMPVHGEGEVSLSTQMCMELDKEEQGLLLPQPGDSNDLGTRQQIIDNNAETALEVIGKKMGHNKPVVAANSVSALSPRRDTAFPSYEVIIVSSSTSQDDSWNSRINTEQTIKNTKTEISHEVTPTKQQQQHCCSDAQKLIASTPKSFSTSQENNISAGLYALVSAALSPQLSESEEEQSRTTERSNPITEDEPQAVHKTTQLVSAPVNQRLVSNILPENVSATIAHLAVTPIGYSRPVAQVQMPAEVWKSYIQHSNKLLSEKKLNVQATTAPRQLRRLSPKGPLTKTEKKSVGISAVNQSKTVGNLDSTRHTSPDILAQAFKLATDNDLGSPGLSGDGSNSEATCKRRSLRLSSAKKSSGDCTVMTPPHCLDTTQPYFSSPNVHMSPSDVMENTSSQSTKKMCTTSNSKIHKPIHKKHLDFGLKVNPLKETHLAKKKISLGNRHGPKVKVTCYDRLTEKMLEMPFSTKKLQTRKSKGKRDSDTQVNFEKDPQILYQGGFAGRIGRVGCSSPVLNPSLAGSKGFLAQPNYSAILPFSTHVTGESKESSDPDPENCQSVTQTAINKQIITVQSPKIKSGPKGKKNTTPRVPRKSKPRLHVNKRQDSMLSQSKMKQTIAVIPCSIKGNSNVSNTSVFPTALPGSVVPHRTTPTANSAQPSSVLYYTPEHPSLHGQQTNESCFEGQGRDTEPHTVVHHPPHISQVELTTIDLTQLLQSGIQSTIKKPGKKRGAPKQIKKSKKQKKNDDVELNVCMPKDS